ncbi:PEP-CTERM sorting domain-containing protein [Aquincola tertiaricarbonis]|uniref:PEP-CTERM sorting domain-containing protein n=1 Tax=Aquincola tertiaricarbonis TaxID=391953 RepID=A0ABY4SD43_AQUTE|nr:PEP-CTERM sorting domain-containing protein [Aquincola tertiaricarbonis]URI10095.1 PEP-CTERM sorting domain-containing protein [Aquincola tertiaricarbonis]
MSACNLRSIVAAAALVAASAAGAADFTVSAKDNCACDNATGAATVSLLAGQSFSVSVNPSQLWAAGDELRWSNADGLVGDRYATLNDGSGQPVGTQIGMSFGNLTQGSLAAPYGALVGQIGGGDFFLVGTSYTGQAASAGLLKLYYWDAGSADNIGSITASVNVSAVPEPGTYALMAGGLALVGFLARRRRA